MRARSASTCGQRERSRGTRGRRRSSTRPRLSTRLSSSRPRRRTTSSTSRRASISGTWCRRSGRPRTAISCEMSDPSGAEMSRLGSHVDPFLALLVPLWWIWSSPSSCSPRRRSPSRAARSRVLARAQASRQPRLRRRVRDRLPALPGDAVQRVHARRDPRGQLRHPAHPLRDLVPRRGPAGACSRPSRSSRRRRRRRSPPRSAASASGTRVRRGQARSRRRDLRARACASASSNILVVIPHFAPAGASAVRRTLRRSRRHAERDAARTAVHRSGRVRPPDGDVVTSSFVPGARVRAVPRLLGARAAHARRRGAGPRDQPAVVEATSRRRSSTSTPPASSRSSSRVDPRRGEAAKRKRHAPTALLATLGCLAIVSPLIYAGSVIHKRSADQVQALRDAVDLIPAGVPTSASLSLGGNVSTRPVVVNFPMIGKATWVIVGPQTGSTLRRRIGVVWRTLGRAIAGRPCSHNTASSCSAASTDVEHDRRPWERPP